MKKSQSENKFSILKQLITGQNPNSTRNSNQKTSRQFFISPSQLISQSLLQDTVFVDYDKSEDESSVQEQAIKVNVVNTSSNDTNTNEQSLDNSKLPKIAKNYIMDLEVIDSHKVKIEDGKPFPLKLLNSQLIMDALDSIKCDLAQYQKIEPICKTLLLRKIFVYVFWIYYCIKFQNDLLATFVARNLREKLKTKYMKLFVMTRAPKDEILEVLPFLLGKALQLTIEKHIKNGKFILNGGDTEMDLYSFVHSELNGFEMSHIYLLKNKRKFVSNESKIQINRLQNDDLFTMKKLTLTQSSQNVSNVNVSGIMNKPMPQKRGTVFQKQSDEVNQFKNQLKKILMAPIDKKKVNQPNKNREQHFSTMQNNNQKQQSPQNKESNQWQWFGGVPGDQSTMMSSTSRFNKFETGKLSPMFTSFYSTNSFTNPISKSNIILKKHITQSQERPESFFEVLLRGYRNEKLKNIEQMKKSNNYQLKNSNMRALNKILGRDQSQKQVQDNTIKRRERKWVIGEQISSDGNIMTSPGLQKLFELKQAVDKVPTNFNFEKRVLNNMYQKRKNTDISTQYNEIADKLLPEYRDLLLQAQLQNQLLREGGSELVGLSHEMMQKRMLQERYDFKMKKILKRKNERLIRRQQEIAKEQLMKEKELKKLNTIDDNYHATIEEQYIRDDDVEFWFENIFHEYADEHLKKKAKQTEKPSSKQLAHQQSFGATKTKVNPYQKKAFTKNDWSPKLKEKQFEQEQQYFKRADLIFKGAITPEGLAYSESSGRDGEGIDEVNDDDDDEDGGQY